MTNEIKILKKKIKLFCEQKIKVHLVKTNKIFYNGIITACLNNNDCFIIADREGNQYVFLEEIFSIEPYQSSTGNEGVYK
jgi:hypothetical protein